MSEDVYRRVADILDTLPAGFPTTESGVERKLLEKIFQPEEAELFCDLRLQPETAEQIAERTGRPLEGLKETLRDMAVKGQCFELRMGNMSFFKMIPWAVGIYEYQLERMDRDFARLNEQYAPVFGKQFFQGTPPYMQTIVVDEAIPNDQEALPYETVSALIEQGQSFCLLDCVCKKEKGLLDQPCDRPVQVCMAIAPVPNYFEEFDRYQHGSISKDKAREVLQLAEESALVHMTCNFQQGRYFICNCCKCCCGVLRSINESKIPASLVVNSHYYARNDPELCDECGTCAEERCQVNAIAEDDGSYTFIREACIGCGLCVSTCPNEAITLVRKDEAQLSPPPETEADWFEERGRSRGVDFSRYK